MSQAIIQPFTPNLSSLPHHAPSAILQDITAPTNNMQVPPARRSIAILGIRGIPARHGGFETFAERLALHLASLDWDIEVFCQDDPGPQPSGWPDRIKLTHLPPPLSGSAGSVLFDLTAMRQAVREPNRVLLVLGYNTALFGLLARLRGRVLVINMDGIEWRRAKWAAPIRAWFWCNERLACWLGDHLIADNPSIADHLATRVNRSKITTIAYGADPVHSAPEEILAEWGLQHQGFALVVARPEPENSILEIVRAYSSRPRPVPLVIVGPYAEIRSRYIRAVREAAGSQVRFIGPVYERDRLAALRLNCRLYLHGHQVGGTNPSLVEAMGAGCAVFAYDNPFNRSVGVDSIAYFHTQDELTNLLSAHLADGSAMLQHLRYASRARHSAAFQWPDILAVYSHFLERCWAGQVTQQIVAEAMKVAAAP